MQYTEGQVGRVFAVRVDDGEDLIASLRQFVADRDIRAGSIIFLGALREAQMVTGPEEPVIPPEPHNIFFEGGWEVFGVGTIYPGEDGPSIHYHCSVGRAGHALTGCLREKAQIYLLVEAIIYEITGLSARREFDRKMQIHLPVLESTAGTGKPGKEEAGGSGEPASRDEKKEERGELPGGLSDIIRDLTRRPPV
jgi:predicted DNA-binding protein with PD1-like motif